jgi:hypothetical protein
MNIPLVRRQILIMPISFLATVALAQTNPQTTLPRIDPALEVVKFDFVEYCKLLVSIAKSAYDAGVNFKEADRKETVERLLNALNQLQSSKRAFVEAVGAGADDEKLRQMVAAMDYELTESIKALNDLDPSWKARHPEIAGPANSILQVKGIYFDQFQKNKLSKDAFTAKMNEEAVLIYKTVADMKQYLPQ